MNRERWRVSYGRQCYKTTFAKTNIFLPIRKNGELDYDYMHEVASNSYNFESVKTYVEN